MARQIYIVNAMIVDANGALHIMDGYPKSFDSKNYGDDEDKAYRRADGDASDTWGDMCKNDTRQIQTVTLSTVDGAFIYRKTTGKFADSEI